MVEALGGRRQINRRLRGWLHLSWHYTRRLRDVEALHVQDEAALAYQQPGLKYAALGEAGSHSGIGAQKDRPSPLHTRDKGWGETAW